MQRVVCLLVLAVALVAAQDKKKDGSARFGPGGLAVPVGGGILPGGPIGGLPACPPVAPPRPVCKFYERNHCGHYVCSVDQKPFECPLVRPECPGLRFGPTLCYTDDDCAGFDKCCPDACLDHLTCKGHSSGVLY
uniref:Crustin 4 n=2 Tax=Macrobrachium rosenbergii TaxID=79674 RepID=A0A173G7W1_MACRS|nr:crustin 4 [Macrobrachium rosenbergii]